MGIEIMKLNFEKMCWSFKATKILAISWWKLLNHISSLSRHQSCKNKVFSRWYDEFRSCWHQYCFDEVNSDTMDTKTERESFTKSRADKSLFQNPKPQIPSLSSIINIHMCTFCNSVWIKSYLLKMWSLYDIHK